MSNQSINTPELTYVFGRGNLPSLFGSLFVINEQER